jgi:rhodanese-related sulfurtransferase
LIPEITPLQADDWARSCRAAGLTPVLLDVREPWELELAQVRIADAEFVPVPMQSIPRALSEGGLERGQPVLVLCHHGIRSMHVARFLSAQGFAQVHNLQGGIDAWSSQRDDKVPVY